MTWLKLEGKSLKMIKWYTFYVADAPNTLMADYDYPQGAIVVAEKEFPENTDENNAAMNRWFRLECKYHFQQLDKENNQTMNEEITLESIVTKMLSNLTDEDREELATLLEETPDVLVDEIGEQLDEENNDESDED